MIDIPQCVVSRYLASDREVMMCWAERSDILMEGNRSMYDEHVRDVDSCGEEMLADKGAYCGLYDFPSGYHGYQG